MRSLSTPELLAMWECALSRSRSGRVLHLLSDWLGEPEEDLARFSIGRRDAHLLELRLACFGPELTGFVDCPACKEHLELRLDINRLRERAPVESDPTLRLQWDGFEVLFRLPTTLDLMKLSADEDVQANQSRLFEHCFLSASQGGTDRAVRDLPEAVRDAVGRRMAGADPLADIEIAVTCPQCGQHSGTTLDIGSFLWREIDAWAQGLLTEVHLLASAYGWSEEAILGMAPARRRCYLDLAAA